MDVQARSEGILCSSHAVTLHNHQMDSSQYHQGNRLGWNEGATWYDEDLERQIAFLRAGGTNFEPPERKFLDGLSSWCERAIHLQCAGGTDTLSLWSLGAKEVLGVDISDRMIAVAAKKSEALGAPATWIRCDVFDTPQELDGTADLVYTGRGALNWLSDLDAWAAVVQRLLKPGGRLYLFEGHPIVNLFKLESPGYELDPDWGDYFNLGPHADQGWPESYIGDLGKPKEQHATKYEFLWKLGDVVNAVIGAGLRLERLEEHPDSYWEMFPNMPSDLVAKLPQTFSLLAFRPG